MTMRITRENGFVQIPVYMRTFTEREEYDYTISYNGFESKILKRGSKWWIVSNDAKWIVKSEDTKRDAVDEFTSFVDRNYIVLKEQGYII